MSNFKSLLDDILLEKGKTYEDLVAESVINERSHYQYNEFTPYLTTIIKIANYLEVSLDYLSGITTNNNFKKYNNKQSNIYKNITQALKARNISQNKISKELPIGRSNFTYWKQGKLPKYITLIEIANYLDCSIDEFLDKE